MIYYKPLFDNTTVLRIVHKKTDPTQKREWMAV